jgi:hypothetical protein
LLASAHCVLIVLISYVSSEVKTYNIGADSTLPRVPKKRKFENDTDEEDVKPKIPKTELTGKAILKNISVHYILKPRKIGNGRQLFYTVFVCCSQN